MESRRCGGFRVQGMCRSVWGVGELRGRVVMSICG